MADKQVVRQDVVEVLYDVDNSPLLQMQKELQEVKANLTSALDGKAFKDFNDGSEKAADGLDEATKAANEFNSDAKKLKNSFEGAADGGDDLKEGMDELNDTKLNKLKSGLTGVENKLSDIAHKASGSVVSGLKKVASVSFKALGVGVAAASAGVVKLTKDAVQGYADAEQLQGGVETLFGAGGAKSVTEYAKSVGKTVADVKSEYKTLMSAQSEVFKNANNAYKTAGLSANEYMETVTSFSASLVASLKGDKKAAAKLSDQAIVDMSDNANKMGTSMESISTAYQGFAKQNYTMLDNLKLGYGGTKEEMKRLIKDASKMDKSVDKNSMSFGNIVKAIHAVQDNLNITGTTSKEASKTISGSLGAMKSAWKNLMPALVSGGDQFDQCVENLVESVKTFGKNIMPAMEGALEGVGALVEGLAPVIERELPTMIEKLLPSLIRAVTSLVKGLIKALPTILATLAKEVPVILKELGSAIADVAGDAFPFLKGFGKFLAENGKQITKFIPILAGLVGAFVGAKKLKGVVGVFSGIFGGKGGDAAAKGGGGLMKSVENFAKAKPTKILKGMANIAIVLGGFLAMAAVVMAVTPYIAKLANMKDILKVVGVMGVLGVLGFALGEMASIVGKIPVSTVLKGLANMAIMIAGMSILFVVLGFITRLNFDYGEILQIVGLIGVLGVVGGVLAAFAAIIGMVPIPVVLMGLASMAIMIAGMTAIIVAFGALSKIPNFKQFLKEGGDTLALLFRQIGKIVGSLIGGIGEGVTAALPAIGANLSKFAKSIKPMFDIFSKADLSGIGGFLVAFGAFLLLMTGQQILSFITGGIDFAAMGSGLSKLATKSQTFFSMVGKLPKKSFDNAKLLFAALSDIGKLPKSGGVVQWFMGEVDYGKVAGGMSKLVNSGSKKFYTTVAKLPSSTFTSIKSLFNALSNIGKLPNSGGVAQWFMGEVDYGKIAGGLEKLSSEKVVAFYNTVAGLSDGTFTNISKLFNALSNIGKLPNSGGVVQWFAGEVDYAKIANGICKLGTDKVVGFYTTVSGLSDGTFTNIKTLFQSLSYIGKLPNSGGVAQWFAGEVDFDKIANGVAKLGSEKAVKFYTTVANLTKGQFTNIKTLFQALSYIGSLPNSGGIAQWFAGEVDYDKVAKGVAKFGNDDAVNFYKKVSEFKPETFTSIKNLFKALSYIGSLPNSNGVAQFFAGDVDYDKITSGMAKFGNTEMQNFYSTISNVDSKVFSNIETLFSSLVSLKDMPSGDDVSSMGDVGTSLSNFANNAADFFNSVANVDTKKFSSVWKTLSNTKIVVTSFTDADKKVTSFEKTIKNLPSTLESPISNTIAKFKTLKSGIKSTVGSISLYQSGKDIMSGLKKGIDDSYDAVMSAITKLGKNIPKKFNLTLKINSPSKIMEESGYFTGIAPAFGIEKAIPKVQSANDDLAKAAGGYALDGDASYSTYSPNNSVNTSTTKTEYNNYSPQFTLNINGSTDNTTERKVKNWIVDALNDVFSDMEATNYNYQEV